MGIGQPSPAPILTDLLKRVTSHRIMKYSLHFLRILNSAYRVYGGCRVECGSVVEVEKGGISRHTRG